MLQSFANVSLDALNDWYGYRPNRIAQGCLNTVQRACLREWIRKAYGLSAALRDVAPKDLVPRPPTLSTLDASRVDVLDRCGRVDVVPMLLDNIANVVTDGPSFSICEA